MRHRTVKRIPLTTLILWAGTLALAQAPEADPNRASSPVPAPRPVEQLNYLGGDAAMPLFSDSVLGVDSAFRKELFERGVALRFINQYQYIQNLLDSPASAHDQVYVGHRPFEKVIVQPILTTDLRQLHLKQAQLYAGGVWTWASWNPGGPKTVQLWDLYFYKAFGEKRVEVKAGYISSGMDFIGFFTGGSTANGAQGVYTILPFEAGMPYFGLTTPAFIVKTHGPRNTYFRAAAQRSMDPKGGPREVARNHTGFRFLPHGDKLLIISEGGFQRPASANAHQAWFRAGYMYNTTGYTSAKTGRSESGNYCAYALMDYQVKQTDSAHPYRGYYVGGTFMDVPETLNPYARYYEARIYRLAPFRNRPQDSTSVVASHTSFSKYFTDNLARAGKTVWRSDTTLTGSYSMHVSRGNYLSAGLAYAYGPAIAPRVDNALKLVAIWTLFF